MTTISKTLIFIFVAGLFSIGYSQQPVSAALKQLLIDRMDAIAKKDTTALGAACTQDYRMITSSGNTYTLPELKKMVITGESPIKQSLIVSYQPFITDELLAFAIFEIQEEYVNQSQGLSQNSLIVTEIYRKEKGKKWKIQLSHISQKNCSFPK